jgi:hypothetical protein
MTDPIQHQALVRDLSRRLATLGLDSLRLIDRFTLALQLHEQEHGPVDLQAFVRLVPRVDMRRPVETAIASALFAVGLELVQEDREGAERQEAARAEMVDEIHIGIPGDGVSLDPMELEVGEVGGES